MGLRQLADEASQLQKLQGKVIITEWYRAAQVPQRRFRAVYLRGPVHHRLENSNARGVSDFGRELIPTVPDMPIMSRSRRNSAHSGLMDGAHISLVHRDESRAGTRNRYGRRASSTAQRVGHGANEAD